MNQEKDINGNIWVTSKLTFKEHALGTKARAIGGGYWIKVKTGWKWCTGSTFPKPGGDWDGTVCLPVKLSAGICDKCKNLVPKNINGGDEFDMIIAWCPEKDKEIEPLPKPDRITYCTEFTTIN